MELERETQSRTSSSAFQGDHTTLEGGISASVMPMTPCMQGGWGDKIDQIPTVIHALYKWRELQPNKTVFSWVNINGRPEVQFTYSDFLSRTTGVALALREQWGVNKGDRAILLYPMGLNFVIAFWGCLQANVVAVPVYPVRTFTNIDTKIPFSE